MHRIGLAAILGLGLGLGLLAGAARAEEPLDLHVIVSLTGTGALLGTGQQQALAVEEKLINGQGGVNGRKVHFVIHDDQSTPQVAVQAAQEILASKPMAFLGPSLTATCAAVGPLVKNGPAEYCLSPGIRPEPGAYAFSATIPHDGFVEAVVRYFHSRGWTRIALIMSTDSTGQDGEKSADRAVNLPDLKDMQIVERVHFNPTDISVSAQVERVAAANPQAVIAWTTGTAMGNVLRAMKQANFDVPLATSTGNLLYSFMERFAAVLPTELVFAGGPGMYLDDRLKLDPGVKAAVRERMAAFDAAGLKVDTSAETVWDPAMLVVQALRKLGPAATAAGVRDFIAGLDAWDGCYGKYDFKRSPQRGLDVSNAVIMRWRPERGVFEPVSQPGGAPL